MLSVGVFCNHLHLLFLPLFSAASFIISDYKLIFPLPQFRYNIYRENNLVFSRLYFLLCRVKIVLKLRVESNVLSLYINSPFNLTFRNIIYELYSSFVHCLRYNTSNIKIRGPIIIKELLCTARVDNNFM